MQRHPYSILQQPNSDNTRYSLILRVNEPAPFQRWSLMIGDCLNNLRASLDHLIYTVAAHESSPEFPRYERALQFPITDSRPEFDKAVERRQLGEISEPVRACIERMQPYNRPHPTLPPLLTILRTLNNADKHRLIHLAYGAIASGQIGFVGEVSQDDRVWTRVINEGEVKDNTEVFAMICDRPTPNMKYDINRLLIIVAIGHGKRDASGPEFTGRSDFAALLDLLSEEVRSVIYYFCKNI
jgi:hypothetical protein